MKSLYIDRSTGSSRDGNWAAELDLEGVERIVVGTGPGSFAGIRAALAFAQGYALGSQCEVRGLPSPCAIAATFYVENPAATQLTVVGDARQGKVWIAEFSGYSLIKPIYQLDFEVFSGSVPRNSGSVPSGSVVVSPDHRRIGEKLKGVWGDRYLGERLPTDDGLRRFAEAAPDALVCEPLPIYLNPAVR